MFRFAMSRRPVLNLFMATVIVAAALAIVVSPAQLQASPVAFPANYRQFKVYAESTADETQAGLIHLAVQFVNQSTDVVSISVDFPQDDVVVMADRQWAGDIKPGETAVWQVDCKVSPNLGRHVLRGAITSGDDHVRDLYLAFRGADAPGHESKDYDTMTRPGVVAAWAPIPSWDAALQRLAATKKPVANTPHVTVADKGRTTYVIDITGALPGKFASPDEAAADPDAASRNEALLAAWRASPEPRREESQLVNAVDDLARVLGASTAADFRLVTTSELAAGAATIQLVIDPAAVTDPNAGAGLMSYDVQPQRITLRGDTPEALRHVIYTFLQDELGARWYQPRKLGEELPDYSKVAWSIPAGRTDVAGSSFFSVGGMSWGAGAKWDNRNRSRVNGGRMNFGHSWNSYINKSWYPYEKFTKYYAQNREGEIRMFDHGWSHSNFCTTNPEVIEIVAGKVEERLSNPDVLVASLDPNDYAPFCLCDNCIAIDKMYGVETGEGEFATDRLLHFSREIHRRLSPEAQKKFLGILIYAYQMEFPNAAKPHDHHIGLICNMPWEYDHSRPFNDPTSPRNRDFSRLVKQWGGAITQMGYYDYYGHWSFWGPWGLLHKIREDMPAFHEAGGTFLMIEAQPNFAINGVNLWIASQLSWNINADVDALLAEFCQGYYGPAAEPMWHYWMTAEKQQNLTRSRSNVQIAVANRPEMWVEMDAWLQQAEAAVKHADQRYIDRITYTRAGLEWGKRRAALEVNYKIRLHRPDTVNRIPEDMDMATLLAGIQAERTWIDATYDKYKGDDYWPPITPAYFKPNMAGFADAIEKAMAEKAAAE